MFCWHSILEIVKGKAPMYFW